MPIGNPKSMQAWDSVKYLGQLYAYSPWQNGFAERLIGSVRRECLDHIIIFSEAHLRRILKSYADYYNSVRTDRSLHKDAPISHPIHQTGIILSHPILGGLHHHYVRV